MSSSSSWESSRQREADRQRRRRQRAAAASSSSSLTTVVTTAAVAYGAYRLVNWAWNQYTTATTAEDGYIQQQGERTRSTSAAAPAAVRTSSRSRSQQQQQHQWRIRRQRMSRCRDEVTKAMEGFLPTLRSIVEERTSAKAETQAMKALRRRTQPERSDDDDDGNDSRRQQEQELWNAIQIKLITRMLATAYAHTILFLVLMVQVNLLGGKLWEEQTATAAAAATQSDDSVASGRMGSYQASHQFVLQHTYDYFFEHGLLALITTVERAVTEVLLLAPQRNAHDQWNVLDPASLNLSRDQFQELIEQIRAVVEDNVTTNTPSSSRYQHHRQRRPRSLFRFLMPPSAHFETNTAIDDALAASILDETWDLMESPVMLDAQIDALQVTFHIMREQGWGTIFANNNDADDDNERTTKPLATVIPQLKHTSNSFYGTINREQQQQQQQESTPNPYCVKMQILPSVLELADVSFN